MNRHVKEASPKWTDEGLPLGKRRELLQQELKELLTTHRPRPPEASEHPVRGPDVLAPDPRSNADSGR